MIGSGFHQFSFRIKFYSSEPSINLQEEITRYQFVLQLKKDIFKGALPAPYETLVELSAQALQGNYTYIIITVLRAHLLLKYQTVQYFTLEIHSGDR